MAKYQVTKGQTFVAANGAISGPGDIVEVDDTKMDIGENLQKPSKKALQAADRETDDTPQE